MQDERTKRYGRLTAKALIMSILIASSYCIQTAFATTSMGMNDAGINYPDSQGAYIDIFMKSWIWQNSAVNSLGYPTTVNTPASCTFFLYGYPTGTYNFYGEGIFNMTISGTGYNPNYGTYGINQGINPGTWQVKDNVTTCQIDLTPPPVQNGEYSGPAINGVITFTVTPTDLIISPQTFILSPLDMPGGQQLRMLPAIHLKQTIYNPTPPFVAYDFGVGTMPQKRPGKVEGNRTSGNKVPCVTKI